MHHCLFLSVMSGVAHQSFVLCTCVVRCGQSINCPVYLWCQVWPINHLSSAPMLSGVTSQPFVLCCQVWPINQLSCVPVLSGVTSQSVVLCTCVVRCDQSISCPVYLFCQVWSINHLSYEPVLSGVTQSTICPVYLCWQV